MARNAGLDMENLPPEYKGVSKCQGVYGCVKHTLPKSSVAIFLKDEDGNLEFKALEKVENVNDPLSDNDKLKVFSCSGGGDSGSPVSAKVMVPDPENGMKEEKRRVMVAVHNAGLDPTTLQDLVPSEACWHDGTKVSEEMISWMKKFDSMQLYSGRKTIL